MGPDGGATRPGALEPGGREYASVFYTSASAPTFPPFLGASVADLNATVTNAVMGGAV